MDKPILFLVDDEPEVVASHSRSTREAFCPDYRIVTDPSCTSALERLERGGDRDQEVALLVTDQGMPEMTRSYRALICPQEYAIRPASLVDNVLPLLGYQ